MKNKSTLLKKLNDGRKKFAVLIDPDKTTAARVKRIAINSQKYGVDFIFYGGSLLTNNNYVQFIPILKDYCAIPVVLFPGNYLQINPKADGILLLSLISGRNPDLLIGKHVIAAPFLKTSGLEILPTGYILVESGKLTTVSYMSNTIPIPSDKNEIAICTAMAGEMLGLKLIYLDAGSGARNPVPGPMISQVKANINIPLIIGGGIKTEADALRVCKAGADVVVVGNAIEDKPALISRIAGAIR